MGNIGGGALVFGSALAEGHNKWLYITGGTAWWFLCFYLYGTLTKESELNKFPISQTANER
jgi:hypothetical protein